MGGHQQQKGLTSTKHSNMELGGARTAYISNYDQIGMPILFQEVKESLISRPTKRVRLDKDDENSSYVHEKINFEIETPPLAPVPAALTSIPSLCHSKTEEHKRTVVGLRRANSLVLSDVQSDWAQNEEFVNPFEDESDIENRLDLSKGFFVGDASNKLKVEKSSQYCIKEVQTICIKKVHNICIDMSEN